MSLLDLKEHGVLLPEEEWGKHSLDTTVPQGLLLLSFGVAIVALVLVYLGGGELLTWVGIVTFLVDLFVITLMCDRAVVRLRRRTRSERRRKRKPPSA